MRSIQVIFFFIVSFDTYASQTMSRTICSGNIRFECSTNNQEFLQKVKILFGLTEKLVQAQGFTTININAYFAPQLSKDSNSYFLGYGQIHYNSNQNRNHTSRLDGLSIIILDRYFGVHEVMNLIGNSLMDLNYIKANQTTYVREIASSFADTISSIPSIQIDKYCTKENLTVTQLIGEKSFRRIEPFEHVKYIDYYFQNDSFHIYFKNYNEPQSKEKEKDFATQNNNQVIQVVNNIQQIIGDERLGYLLFINDSCFFYIDINKYIRKQSKGPYMVKGLNLNNPEYYIAGHKYFRLKDTILDLLFIDSRRVLGNCGFLFVPNKNLVLPKYCQIEDSVLSHLIAQEIHETEVYQFRLFPILLICILAFSIFFNIILFIRSRK